MPSVDIGIDLGTANVIITMGNKGIVLDEPSVVAYNKKTNEVVAVGDEAYRMLGKTPGYIVAVKPLADGVISDHMMAESMICAFIKKVTSRQLLMPRIVICVPSGVTGVESRAVVDAARNSGSRKIYLIQEPIAALIGAGVDIDTPTGNMIVDIGGGTTDVAAVSMNGVVKSASVKVGGNKIDQAIVKYITNTYKLLIGEKTAEQMKMGIANVYNPDGTKTMTIKGRNLLNGLPEAIVVTDLDVYKAIMEQVTEIITTIRSVLEVTPPELIGDIHTNGIYLTGGGALLGGLAELIYSETGIPCRVAENPMTCVARGTCKAFTMLDKLLDGFQSISLYKF